MGGTTGKLGHFGIAKEVTFGTPVGATAHLPFNSETLDSPIEELIEASIKARHDEGNSYEGLNTVAGDSVHEVHPAGLGYLLRSALRSPETTANPAAGSYTHVFKPPAGRAILSDTAQASTSGSVIYLTSVTTDDMYNGCWCHIKTGTAAGQWVIITDSVASTNTISVVTSPACVATDTLEIMVGPEHCAQPPYTLEIHRDLTGTTPAFQYTSCVVNTLNFTIGAANKIMTATASWLGKSCANLANTSPNLPTTDPFMWDDCVLGIGKKSGATASGAGTTTTLVDTGTWTASAEIGNIVITTGGTGANQCRRIISNTTDALTVSAWHTAPDATTTYEIFYGNFLLPDLTFGWTSNLVGTPTNNYTNTIYKIEQSDKRIGTATPTFIPEQTTDFSTYFRGWTTREWVLYFHGGLITAGVPNHYYDFFLHFPRVRFTAYPINIGGPGPIRVGATCKLKYDSDDGYFVKAILQNNTSNYA